MGPKYNINSVTWSGTTIIVLDCIILFPGSKEDLIKYTFTIYDLNDDGFIRLVFTIETPKMKMEFPVKRKSSP